MDLDRAGRSTPESVDARIARLVSRRHGVLSRGQALKVGASTSFIDRRVAAGRWQILHPGVYRIAGTPNTYRQSLLAACLAAGRDALASHRAAATVSGLPGGRDGVEITVPRGRRVRRDGMVIHEGRDLGAEDRTVIDAIPVTTPTRTIIDLASVVDADVLEEALDEALRRTLTSVRRLAWRLTQLGTRGRPGAGRLAKLVETRIGSTVPESPLETRFLRLLRRAGLPLPSSQFEIRDQGRLLARVDFAYPDVRLAIEVDGYRWHSGRARWEHDLGRRNRLTALGWRVIHVTSSDLDRGAAEIIQVISAMLTQAAPFR